MIRSALLLCAGLLVAMCCACAQTTPAWVGPGSGGGPGILTGWPIPAASCNGATFAESVRMLPADFDPSKTNTDPPQGGALVHRGRPTTSAPDLAGEFS